MNTYTCSYSFYMEFSSTIAGNLCCHIATYIKVAVDWNYINYTCSALLYDKVNWSFSLITNASSFSDNKGLLSVRVLLEGSKKGSLLSNGKCAINTRWNKINSDSSEQKYTHLSNSSIQTYEICYTFTVWVCPSCCGFILWECHTCPLFGVGLHSRFSILPP